MVILELIIVGRTHHELLQVTAASLIAASALDWNRTWGERPRPAAGDRPPSHVDLPWTELEDEMGCASWEVGDWGLRRGSAAQSGGTNRRLVVPCTVGAPSTPAKLYFLRCCSSESVRSGALVGWHRRNMPADFFTSTTM